MTSVVGMRWTHKDLHTVLAKNRIHHDVYQGNVTVGGEFFEPHFWIVLSNGEVVDYRLRMWFGDDAPHGIFKPKDEGVKYDGVRSGMPVLSDALFEVLVNN